MSRVFCQGLFRPRFEVFLPLLKTAARDAGGLPDAYEVRHGHEDGLIVAGVVLCPVIGGEAVGDVGLDLELERVGRAQLGVLLERPGDRLALVIGPERDAVLAPVVGVAEPKTVASLKEPL